MEAVAPIAEKINASTVADAPNSSATTTAEANRVPGPPPLLSGGCSIDGGVNITRATPRADVVAAERREAELRAQALLRVQLAAAKRTASSVVGSTGAGTPGQTSSTTAPMPENTGVDAVEDRHESRELEGALRSRLRARKG